LHITNVGNEAQKYLVSIRSQFETNDRIREDFGDLTKGIDVDTGLEYNLTGTWSKSMFYVRRSNRSLKDPTMQAIGMGTAITGARFDGIIGDDIIDKSDVDTVKKRDEIEAWWNVILELLDTGGWALMIGTRKNGDDLYERLQNKSTWTYSIDKAIIKYPTTYEFIKKPDENGIEKLVGIKQSGDGQVLAPDMWTMEQLLEKKLENETTPWLFDREQQQEVTEEKNKVFQMEWMKANDFEFTPDGNIKRLTDGGIANLDELVIIDGTDLASSKKDSADYFVDITIAMDYKFNAYILDFTRKRLTFDEQFRAILGQHRTWGSQLVGIEDVAYQKSMEQHLVEVSEVPAVGVPRANDKIQRMFAIQPYFQNRKVFFLKGKMGLVKGELNDFPDGAHDDIPDALETAIQLGIERMRSVVDLRTKVMARAITIDQFRDKEQMERQIGVW
jgi:predicted phage terminase large subunit-like protein